MFGSRNKRKEADLEKLTDMWMGASLMLVDVEEVKSNPSKYKTTLAYFFGTTDVGGRNSGLGQDTIMEIYLRCLANHFNLKTQSEIRKAYETLNEISADMKYVEIMRKGIEVLDDWVVNQNHSAPAWLSVLLIGKGE